MQACQLTRTQYSDLDQSLILLRAISREAANKDKIWELVNVLHWNEIDKNVKGHCLFQNKSDFELFHKVYLVKFFFNNPKVLMHS